MEPQTPRTKAGSRRSDHIRRSFEKKLEILERLAKAKQARTPLKTWYPTSLREFRDWRLEGEFDSWTSQSIDAPNGRYPELAKRLAKLLRTLNSDPLDEENKRLRLENEVLMKQNVRLEILVRKLQDEITLLGPGHDRANVVDLYQGLRRP